MNVKYKGQFISIEEKSFPNKNNPSKPIVRDIVMHPGAIVVLPVLEDSSIYFIKQYRHAVDRYLLEIPAGKLEKGEDPKICAERELMEEIGFKPKTLISLGEILPAPGFCNEIQYAFLAKDLVQAKLPCDDDEEIEVVNLKIAEIYSLIKEGKIIDAKSLAVIFKAQLLGLV